MAARNWILIRPDGSVAAQLKIEGAARPSETGDNPDGLQEVRVTRHGDLRHQRYDVAQGRWVGDRAKKAAAERQEWLRGLSRTELADTIAAETEARLRPEIEALAARIAALEGKA
jgi:hypothetical protein